MCGPGGTIPDAEHNVWPNQFRRWLNHNFPCSGPGGHQVHNLAESASGSDYWSFRIFDLKKNSSSSLWKADLVVVETAVNDIRETQRASTGGEAGDGKIQYFTELMARQLLSAPKRPALIWLTVGAREWWPNSPPPHHKDATYAHLPVLEYYDIPQISVIHAFLPLTRDRSEWLKKHYFEDSCCHPSVLGHMMCAQVLGSALMEESAFMDATATADTRQRRAWFTSEPVREELPQAMFRADDDTLRLDTGSVATLDLTDPHRAEGHVQARSGFEFTEDVQGKPGLIAMDVGADVTIGMALRNNGGGAAELNVGMLKSYERMGVVRVSYALAPAHECGSPASFDKGLEFKSAGEIDASWSVRASVHDFTAMKLDLQGLGETEACLWLNFRVVPASPPRELNKIKLLDLLLV
mmetsp:Transcript_68634/g.182558  ORF Transcript_68634/g.182558 Transcript_68634/m.182558 type:complete len:410 (-) Transcript_68634:63-1292(-)